MINRRCLCLGVAVSVMQLVAPFTASADSSVSVTMLERRFLEGKYDKAAETADQLIDARATKRDEIYYLKGLSLLRLGRYEDARTSFQAVLDKYSSSSYAFDSMVGIGDSYYLSKRYDEAIRSYSDVLNKFPNHKNSPVVFYKLGRCYKDKGQNDKAAENFTKVKKLAPLSFESRLIDDEDLLAISKRTVSKNEPATSSGGVYSVQVGYFKSRKNADRLAKKIDGQGFSAYVDSIGDFHRTKVGHYATKREANDAASKLRKLGYSTKICTGSYCSAE